MKSFEGEWNRSAEIPMAQNDEMNAGLQERMIGVQTYVTEVLADDNLVTVLISQKFVEKVGNNESAARKFAQENPHIIPRDVKEDGVDYEIAFVLKLAEALDAPEYNQ